VKTQLGHKWRERMYILPLLQLLIEPRWMHTCGCCFF